ncbi:hypothetical protein AB0L70_15265 [Kribbella sp. NPDC051952]|uniref:hypothetical protein n=1 Tax=Kribbella sp. NPDC051952 TaxID=3154851 RepID=UPI003434EC27
MTEQLKELMTDAADDLAPYSPDLDALLRDGRRQVRNRRLLTSISTAAAVLAITCATTFAVNTWHRSTPQPAAEVPTAPASLPDVGPGGSTEYCTTPDGQVAAPWSWPVVVYSQDTFGMSIVHRSPADPKVIAYCTSEWGNGAQLSVVPGGALNGLVLRKSAAVGRGALPGSSVTTVFGTVPAARPPKVIVETSDGHLSFAKVKDGQFVYRHVEHSPWPGPNPKVIVRFQYPGQPAYVVASR